VNQGISVEDVGKFVGLLGVVGSLLFVGGESEVPLRTPALTERVRQRKLGQWALA
jgi:hypothetical protein